jgi:hypothetical protein
MYETNDENLKKLQDAINYLDGIDVKGIFNAERLVVACKLIQDFANTMTSKKESDGLVVDNTLESNKDGSGG